MKLRASKNCPPKPNQPKDNTMSKHEARIDHNFFTFIVRIDRDGTEQVIHGYKGRTFASRKAAELSTARYIAKLAAINQPT